MYTLMSTFLAVVFAAILTQTRKGEAFELLQLEQKTREAAEGYNFDDDEGVGAEARSNASSAGPVAEEASQQGKGQALRKAARIIQDYHFKHNVLVGLSFATLGVVSAATMTLANAPYQLLFIAQALLTGLNWEGALLQYQRYLSKLLTFLLVAELTGQYALYIYSFSEEYTMRQKYQREVAGLLFNTTSFVVFGLKVLLFMIECQRFQFTRHLTQLTFIPAVQDLVAKVSSKSSSSASSILMPLSQFLFCTVAILFAFLHPSALFVPFIPVLIMAYFSDAKDHASCCNVFRLSSRLFVAVTTVFILALYAYQLYTLN